MGRRAISQPRRLAANTSLGGGNHEAGKAGDLQMKDIDQHAGATPAGFGAPVTVMGCPFYYKVCDSGPSGCGPVTFTLATDDWEALLLDPPVVFSVRRRAFKTRERSMLANCVDNEPPLAGRGPVSEMLVFIPSVKGQGGAGAVWP